jgi:hypothetical protein
MLYDISRCTVAVAVLGWACQGLGFRADKLSPHVRSTSPIDYVHWQTIHSLLAKLVSTSAYMKHAFISYMPLSKTRLPARGPRCNVNNSKPGTNWD